MEMDNARVLVADQKIETIKEILPVLEQMTRINQPLLIITEDITGGQQLPKWPAGMVASALCLHAALRSVAAGCQQTFWTETPLLLGGEPGCRLDGSCLP